MPFTDPHHVLKPTLFKTDPNPTKLLLGDDPKSVLVLRSLAKFGALLAAGVVIASSIVLKDVPLISINLLLTCVILFYQIYKLVVDNENRLRFAIELFIILVAAGLAVWLAYPLLIAAPISYLSVLIFANYIATVINISAYASGFFSPFISGCLRSLFIRLGLMQMPIRSKFALHTGSRVALNKLQCKYNTQANQQTRLLTALNSSILHLDKKLLTIQDRFFASELYADKLAAIKSLIRDSRLGKIGDLLVYLQDKGISRLAKLKTVRDTRAEANRVFSQLSNNTANQANELKAINEFLKQYTRLGPLQGGGKVTSQQLAKQLSSKKQSIDRALSEAERYHSDKFTIFKQLLDQFVNVGITDKMLPELPNEGPAQLVLN